MQKCVVCGLWNVILCHKNNYIYVFFTRTFQNLWTKRHWYLELLPLSFLSDFCLGSRAAWYDIIIPYLLNTLLLFVDIWTYIQYWNRRPVLLLSCILTGIPKNCGISNLLFYALNIISDNYPPKQSVKLSHRFSINCQSMCCELIVLAWFPKQHKAVSW